MKSDAALRYQQRLHRDMEDNALRNAHNGARYAAAWHAYLRGERATEPTHQEFEINAAVASAIARQCAIAGKFPCVPKSPGISTAGASVGTGDAPAAGENSVGTSAESSALAQSTKEVGS